MITETKALTINGFIALLAVLLCLGGAFLLGWKFITTTAVFGFAVSKPMLFGSILLLLISVLVFSGITVVQPNEAKVVTFFGSYVGSIRDSGIWFTLPLTVRKKVSLRVHNFNSARLKVNDVEGNPVEIAAVVVFKVVDSARALFDVEDYEEFVEIQSETALRHIATQYPYDNFEDSGYSLRGNAEEVSEKLGKELQERLSLAGVEVLEARLTHLAYATEIAHAMLQRQQARAILAARQIIVEGAVSMAHMAIDQLQESNAVNMDEKNKMSMINNLLVAIVSDRSAQPVINTGSSPLDAERQPAG